MQCKACKCCDDPELQDGVRHQWAGHCLSSRQRHFSGRDLARGQPAPLSVTAHTSADSEHNQS